MPPKKNSRPTHRKRSKIGVSLTPPSANVIGVSARLSAHTFAQHRLARIQFLENEVLTAVDVIRAAQVELESPELNAPEHVMLCMTPLELKNLLDGAKASVEATFAAREAAALAEGARKAHQDLVDAIEALPSTTSAEEFVQWVTVYMTEKGF